MVGIGEAETLLDLPLDLDVGFPRVQVSNRLVPPRIATRMERKTRGNWIVGTKVLRSSPRAFSRKRPRKSCTSIASIGCYVRIDQLPELLATPAVGAQATTLSVSRMATMVSTAF